MKKKIQLLLLLFSISFSINAQQLSIALNIGDTAPPLKVKNWIKGKQITKFEKNRIYIVEFWATWCGPCMASLPRLSVLANKYKDSVTVLAIDIYEKQNTPITKIENVVKTMGNRMDFSVGIDDGNFMAKNWVDTSEARGIPTSFIINNGKIDWIGHPMYLDSVLTSVLNKTWNPKLALLKRSTQLFLDHLNFESANEFVDLLFRFEIDKTNNLLRRVRISPDSVLAVIDERVGQIPTLKFLPVFISVTLPALLETDQQKAYLFAKEAMLTPTVDDDPDYYTVINQIEESAYRLHLSNNFYLLAAKGYQQMISSNPYPEMGDMLNKYKKMAKLYRRAGEEQLATEADENGKQYSLSQLLSNPNVKL